MDKKEFIKGQAIRIATLGPIARREKARKFNRSCEND